MSSVFPGMDPYLEHPELWPEVHHRLIVAIADMIETSLPPHYRVAIEKRVYRIDSKESVLIGIPDVTLSSQEYQSEPTEEEMVVALEEVAVASAYEPLTITLPMPEEIREGYLEIREVATGDVITVIEILSPKNKLAGEGRKTYQRKQRRILETFTNLVEIDLLRAGKPSSLLGNMPKQDYRILVSREYTRPRAQLYLFNVRDKIPSFPLPLQPGEPEPIIDLQTLLDGIYKRARYHLTINYANKPVPQLKKEDIEWADTLLRNKGLR